MAPSISRTNARSRNVRPEKEKAVVKVAEQSDASDVESEGEMEMNEEEKALNRLVMGEDEDDFMAALRGDGAKGEEAGSDEDEDQDMMDVEDEEDKDNLENVDDAELFFMDDGADEVDPNALIQPHSSDDEEEEGNGPAWDDSDDDRLMISLAGNSRLRKLRVSEAEDMVSGKEYAKRLRRQFQRMNPVPEWAQAGAEPPAKRRRTSDASSESDSDDDEELVSQQPLAQLIRSSNALLNTSAAKKNKLRPEVIDIQRTRDIAMVQPSAIASLQFHPIHPVLMSSGPASTIYLHHVAPDSLPEPNPLLTSIHIKKTPLHTTAFLGPKGDKIFFAGRRRHFHTWDLESGNIQKVTRVYGQKEEQKSMERFKLSPCGRFMGLVGTSKKGGGVVNILDAYTSQWIAQARVEGRNGVADFAWWRNGNGMTIASKGGEIGEWSMESKSFVALWQDDGAVGTSVLTLGGKSGQQHLGGDRWVVIGSSSGIVNIYDRKPWTEKGVINIPQRPEPTRVFKQLTTPTSVLEISPDGQLLVIASKWKKDALRLIHLPSCTVYRNWPTSQTPFGRVTAVSFNAKSDLLAVASEQGKIKLWEIRA